MEVIPLRGSDRRSLLGTRKRGALRIAAGDAGDGGEKAPAVAPIPNPSSNLRNNRGGEILFLILTRSEGAITPPKADHLHQLLGAAEYAEAR